jgi:hypothetical protein
MKQDKKEEILSEDEFCHYSGLPSPAAYQLDVPTMIVWEITVDFHNQNQLLNQV